MDIVQTELPGVFIIKPKIFGDTRGYFFESFSREKYAQAGITREFVQDNESMSRKGVLRGLHLQLPPYAQSKLVRVVRGAVLDVAVDLRKNSSTYGRHVAVELNEENKWQFYIPQGFAHGFLVLREPTVFCYKVDAPYAPTHEVGIHWNDPELNIDWQLQKYDIEQVELSEKDKLNQAFTNFVSPF